MSGSGSLGWMTFENNSKTSVISLLYSDKSVDSYKG